MDTFKGTMRMAGEHDAVPFEARIDDLRVVLVVEGVEVGAWPRDDVKAERTGAGVLLDLGSERVELDVTDRSALLARLEPAVGGSTRRRRPRESRRRLPPWPLVVFGAFAAVVVAAVVVYPLVTGSALLLVGAALLVVGALAYVETGLALRLPLGLAPLHFVVGGGILVVGGAGLILLG